MPATYHVYILQKCKGCFYVGLSDDVARRVEQHDAGDSHWTKGRGPWKIVWQSEGLSLTDARKLENRLKRQGRGKGFYSITGFASTRFIIRQPPNRGFKSRPRNQINLVDLETTCRCLFCGRTVCPLFDQRFNPA